jgi:hypothetical protein
MSRLKRPEDRIEERLFSLEHAGHECTQGFHEEQEDHQVERDLQNRRSVSFEFLRSEKCDEKIDKQARAR